MPAVRLNLMPERLDPQIAIGPFVVSAAGSVPCEERASAKAPFLVASRVAPARTAHRRSGRFHGAP
jgi:hypothetical protein